MNPYTKFFYIHKFTAVTPAIVPSTWYNELGSKMVITDVDPSGAFKGTYSSAVGNAKYTYPLTGQYDTQGSTLGWAVTWQNQSLNAHSTTTWSGQLQSDSMLITRLLTSQMPSENDWKFTNVQGFDIFTQTPIPAN